MSGKGKSVQSSGHVEIFEMKSRTSSVTLGTSSPSSSCWKASSSSSLFSNYNKLEASFKISLTALVLDRRDNLLFKLPVISTRSLLIPTRAWDCDCNCDSDDDEGLIAAIEEGGDDGGGGGGARKLVTSCNWRLRVWRLIFNFFLNGFDLIVFVCLRRGGELWEREI